MEAANRGARSDGGGKSIGFNIALPFEQAPNPYITSVEFRVPLFLHAEILVRLSRELWSSFPADSGPWTN